MMKNKAIPPARTQCSGGGEFISLEDNHGEKMLVEDLKALSKKERERVYEEVHGVRKTRSETPLMITKGLAEMEAAISQARSRSATSTLGLDKAIFLQPLRVYQDWNLRLQFLRCEAYDPIKAANRYIRYYDLCFELFGYDGVARDLQLSDLTNEEIDILRCGVIQPLLNTRDRSGRPIFLFFNCIGRYANRHLMLRRAGFFLLSHALKHPVVQQKGFVWISWNVGQTPAGDPPASLRKRIIPEAATFFASMPWRISAIHYCYDNPRRNPFMNILKLMVGAHGRVRFRSHYGSADACGSELQAYGVSPNCLPGLSPSFHMSISHLESSMMVPPSAMNAPEGSPDEGRGGVCCPRSTDVLLGRGKPFREFPGNRRLNQMVLDHWEAYRSLPRRHQKTLFIESFAQHVLQLGVRFLARSSPEDGWREVSYDKILAKVSTSFRNKPLVERYHERKRAPKAAVTAAAPPTDEDGHGSGSGGSDHTPSVCDIDRMDWSIFPQMSLEEGL